VTSPLDRPCTTVVELVTEYVEDELAPHQRTSYELHVVYCVGCAAFLGQMRETVDGLGELPLDRVDEDERTLLVSAFRKERA
jgi:hypothetical protein